MTNPITCTQERLLNHIKRYIERESIPPTIRELTEIMKYRSETAVVEALHSLERKGFIKRTPNISRGLKVL